MVFRLLNKSKKMKKMKIFLTGGDGMLGRNIKEHTFSNFYDFISPTKKELDLTNKETTKRFIVENNPDLVIHAAGLVGGIQSNIANPISFLVTNFELARNVILSAHEAGIPKLINLACSCIYPRNALNPLKESMLLKGELEPSNEGFALGKLFGVRLCEYINRENAQQGLYSKRFKSLISCNIYGRYDKFDPNNSHLIPAIIHKLHVAKKNLHQNVSVWGDGTARREFMYAEDLADAVYNAIKLYDELPDLLNIGLGYDHSINEYYETVAKAIKWNGKFLHDISKPVGMEQKVVDITLQRKWGWAPSTSLLEGIEKTYDYYLSFC